MSIYIFLLLSRKWAARMSLLLGSVPCCCGFFVRTSCFWFSNTEVQYWLFLSLSLFSCPRIGIWHGTQKIQTSPHAFRTQSCCGFLVFTCGSASQCTPCTFAVMTGATSKCPTSTKPKRYVALGNHSLAAFLESAVSFQLCFSTVLFWASVLTCVHTSGITYLFCLCLISQPFLFPLPFYQAFWSLP